MRQDDKREHRELKREIKRAGHKHRRRQVKRAITETPDEAAHVRESFGRHRSADLNGVDRDATRRARDEDQAGNRP